MLRTTIIAPRVTQLLANLTTGVWTGTTTNGTAAGAGGAFALGYGTIAEEGVSAQVGNDWIEASRIAKTNQLSFYAISGVITAVPELTTALLLGLGLAGLATRSK